jgi:CHAT domain-containing protein
VSPHIGRIWYKPFMYYSASTAIIAAIAFLAVWPSHAQRLPPAAVPPELQLSDPEIRGLIELADSSCSGNSPQAVTSKIRRAIDLSRQKGLIGDRAVLEASLASLAIGQGKVDDGKDLLQQALQDSIDSGRRVLEVDILTSIASLVQLRGENARAVELLNKALSEAEETQNLYGKARAQGELARLRLLAGKTDEAAALLSEALTIDRVNGYKFEAIHLYYQGVYFGIAGDETSAIRAVSEAREKAAATKDTFTFISAEDAYALGLARAGKTEEAIREMELLDSGDLSEFVTDAAARACMQSSFQSPLMEIVRLEGFANVLEAAHKSDKEIELWHRVFAVSAQAGLLDGEAEGKQKAADLENQLKRPESAVDDYRSAADLFRRIQNSTALNQVEIAEALLLVQLGRSNEAVPIIEEIASYADRHKMRALELSSYLELGEIYQPAGDLKSAQAALEKAQMLVAPGPFDLEVDNHQVHEIYVRLSDIYRSLKMPTRELISIDKAFFVSVHVNDDKSQQAELGYLNQRLSELDVRNLAAKSQESGSLGDSLIYSCILYIHDGYPSKSADDHSNWQRIQTLPFLIAQQSQGAAILEQVVNDLGPVMGVEKLPLLDALARFYIGAGSNPALAEKYAVAAITLLHGLKGDTSVLQTEPTCILALSHARQNKNALAKDESRECTSLASKIEDPQTVTYADAIKVLVDSQLGDFASTRSSIESLISKSAYQPELQIELVVSLANAKLYDEAKSQLRAVTDKLISAGSRREAGDAFLRVATVLGSDLSDPAKTLDLSLLNSALEQYRECKALDKEAETSVFLGDYYARNAQKKEAIEAYRRAQEVAATVNQQVTIAEGLLGEGTTYQSEQNYSRAVELHREAADIFRKLNDGAGECLALRNLVLDYRGLPDLDNALKVAMEARQAGELTGELDKYFAEYLLGDIYALKGRFQDGLGAYREAATVTDLGGDSEHGAYAHLALAQLDTVIGNWDESVREAQTAMDLSLKAGSKEAEGATWAELMSIYEERSSSVKDFAKAEDCYRRAKELGVGKSLQVELIELDVQTGKFSEAAAIARDAIKDCQKERDTDCEAEQLISVSEAERLSGNLSASASALNNAGRLVSKSQDVYLIGRQLYAEANLLKAQNKLDNSRKAYQQLTSLIENVRGGLDPHSQSSISENYDYIYDEMVSLLYVRSVQVPPAQRPQVSSEAFTYAEKNKARQFAQSWGQVFESQIRPTLPPEIQERERTLLNTRDRLTREISEVSTANDATNASQLVELRSQLSDVENELKQLLVRIREIAPEYAAIAYPEDVRISDLTIRPNETVVEFKVTESSTFVWMIQNPDGVRNRLTMFYEVPRTRAWLRERFSSIQRALNAAQLDSIDWKLSEELFATLFPRDAAQVIAESPEIVFIPDDVLFVLPLEVLSPAASGGDFVLLRKPTTYYPSAASFQLARRVVHPAKWSETFLGVGDPITSPDDDRFQVAQALKSTELPGDGPNKSPGQPVATAPDPIALKSRGLSFDRIPGTGLEVKAIAALLADRHEKSDVRLGASATKQALLDTDLSRFRFVHFATHGLLPTDSSVGEPSLVLSYDGVALSHMFLSMSEIIRLKLTAESVVLSACNTGSGKITRTEGVMSLGRAFLAAGSNSVTVSLWQVSDESTSLLMENYYKGLLEHKAKSVALADARYTVFKNGSKNPFYWAPFVVIGE